MFLTTRIVRLCTPLPRLTGGGKYLFIGPHPDDIEIGAGASAAALAAMGKQLRFLICMDGRFGTDHLTEAMTPDELVSRRHSEAIKSAAQLGVSDVRFLDLPDGGFCDSNRLRQLLAEQISEFQPDVIFAPDPTVCSESHPDHLACGEAVRHLAPLLANPGVMAQYGCRPAALKAAAWYMTASCNAYLPTGKHFHTQMRAIFDCHTSQYPKGHPDSDALALYLKIRSAEAGLHSLSLHGEGFRVQAPVHMHCLPEAR